MIADAVDDGEVIVEVGQYGLDGRLDAVEQAVVGVGFRRPALARFGHGVEQAPRRMRLLREQVLVENGGTVVIGGIFELFEDNNETKVPLLGDIPYVGNLFKNRAKTANKSELLIFITPRVISDRGVMR